MYFIITNHCTAKRIIVQWLVTIKRLIYKANARNMFSVIELRISNGVQWHNVYNKFSQNRSSASQLVSEHIGMTINVCLILFGTV